MRDTHKKDTEMQRKCNSVILAMKNVIENLFSTCNLMLPLLLSLLSLFTPVFSGGGVCGRPGRKLVV